MSCRPNYLTELPTDCVRQLLSLATSGELASRWKEAAHAAFAVWSYLQPIVLGSPDEGPLVYRMLDRHLDDAEASFQLEQLLDPDRQASLSEEAARLLLSWLFERILSRFFR